MANNIFSDFTQLYSVQKTLRFSLIPQGDTAEKIKEYGILEDDAGKAEMYKIVKPILDKCHQKYAETMLSKLSIDWHPLAEIFFLYQKDKSESVKKKLENTQKSYRVQISKFLKSAEYKQLEPNQIIDAAKKQLAGKSQENHFINDLTEQELQALISFDEFSTYFQGYKENRANMYSDSGSTSIACRLVEDNFPKFLNNIKLFSKLEKTVINEIESQMVSILKGQSLESIFDIEFFNRTLTQSGIAYYNLVMGGNTEEGNKKIKGLNELCNEAYQVSKIDKKVKFSLLFKQILSEKESISFLFEAFEDDADIITAIKAYTNILFSEEIQKVFASVKQMLCDCQFDTTRVYVDKKQIPVLSGLVFDEWDRMNVLLNEQKIKKQNVYTLWQLQSATEENLVEKFTNAIESVWLEVVTCKEKILPVLSQNEITGYDTIKEYLDAIIKLEKLFKIWVISDDYEKDNVFYSDYDIFYDVLRDNISLYNKVRNYATKKPYSTEKFKLNFYSPTLAKGWDQNKEYANNAIIFIKDKRYYLGIYNPKNKQRLVERDIATDNCYRKMIYKLLPGPNKMLPKVFFSKKGIETFGVEQEILDGYNAGRHKKGEKFDLEFCYRLIDYFKEKISIHPDWKKFKFHFSETQNYNDISEFYREISEQGYKITYSYVQNEDIEKAIKEGKLFLFEIYNKDFSQRSTGIKNLHTLYWENIFTRENLENVVIKLNGEAELFYRRASVKNPFIHRQNDVIANKIDIAGNTIKDEMLQKINGEIASGATIEQLTKLYPMVRFRLAPHDIIKDKRYCTDSFSFHVPITLNCNAGAGEYEINRRVLELISKNPDVKILGIDRGERNLIYVSLIDQRGNILEQRHFNIINGTDYLQKLKIVARERDDARKKWKSIGKIKDIKEGYLSLVIHEITEMMLKNNAIIVMEDLNIGFKRGRFHFEQQVYQKFEKMLIDKLNYLADKTKINSYEEGGVCNAYQLTTKFESFQKLGKQSGFLFYIPARYTSKIDPKTGFVNLFTSEHMKSKEFFYKFRSIEYDSSEDVFVFEFDYRDFGIEQDYTNCWKISTYGDSRIAHSKKNGQHTVEYVNVTMKLKELFEKYGIDWNAQLLKKKIETIDSASFRSSLAWLFKLTVTLRHEDETQDYILSPVKNNDGTYFDSRYAKEDEPIDGDANGAYHIALQGLRLLKERIEEGKIKKDGDKRQTYNWLAFAQKQEFRS